MKNHTTPAPKTKPKSTQAAKNDRINVCLDLLRQGKKRAEILEHIQTCYSISVAQIDNYLHAANKLLASECAESYAVLKADRQERDLNAAKSIPTNAEIIAALVAKIDFDNPVPTGYELKPIDGIFQNIPRYASETFYLTAITKIIEYNNNLAASTNTNENTIQAVLVINTSERLSENEDELTE